MMLHIVCADCGAMIDPATESSSCPVCGSENRRVDARDETTLKSYEDTRVKKKRPGTKPYEKVWTGYSQSETGEWNWRRRIVDRDHDRYFEHIEDVKGNVIHHVEEPLSEHRGHGDAKRAKKSPKP